MNTLFKPGDRVELVHSLHDKEYGILPEVTALLRSGVTGTVTTNRALTVRVDFDVPWREQYGAPVPSGLWVPARDLRHIDDHDDQAVLR